MTIGSSQIRRANGLPPISSAQAAIYQALRNSIGSLPFQGDDGRRRLAQWEAAHVRLRPENLGRRAINTVTAPEETPVETRLVALLDHLGIAGAHFAGRAGTDWERFAARYPDRVASLTLLCPASLDRGALQPLASRLLILTGDHGPGPRRVQAVLPDLPQATTVVLRDYAGMTWSDLAVERGGEIGGAMQDFLARSESNRPLPAPGLPDQEGEIGGISYSVHGAGP